MQYTKVLLKNACENSNASWDWFAPPEAVKEAAINIIHDNDLFNDDHYIIRQALRDLRNYGEFNYKEEV